MITEETLNERLTEFRSLFNNNPENIIIGAGALVIFFVVAMITIFI